jgi:hypothetical protein
MQAVVIEESKMGISIPGMLLSPFGDLSHTSILYCHSLIVQQNI